ncbi:MAG TPA: ATP-binding protein [Planctomycetota bacterium]|jgi:signal transduction histidine kinase|nr:ATP-binding protein [Planctomycetota bacterium]
MHRERMAGLGELTAGIAHELNNPIGYIGSNLNTLRRYVESMSKLMAQAESFMAPEQRAAWQQALDAARWSVIRDDLVAVVDETRDGAEHVKNVVGDLKLLARTSVTPEQGCVDQCVSSAFTVLTHQLKHRCRVERDLSCHEGLLLVRSQIIQLVINLVHNASQAVAANGRVRVTSRGQEGLAIVTVEDDGPGVPPNLRQEIFQAFYTSKKNGTGLGLPIVARIARNHGGDVRLDSSPDLGGARFTVELRHWQGAAVP